MYNRLVSGKGQHKIKKMQFFGQFKDHNSRKKHGN